MLTVSVEILRGKVSLIAQDVDIGNPAMIDLVGIAAGRKIHGDHDKILPPRFAELDKRLRHVVSLFGAGVHAVNIEKDLGIVRNRRFRGHW